MKETQLRLDRVRNPLPVPIVEGARVRAGDSTAQVLKALNRAVGPREEQPVILPLTFAPDQQLQVDAAGPAL
ncbi:MAG: hypothetical protein ACOCWF_01345 [Halochromatium sp.]